MNRQALCGVLICAIGAGFVDGVRGQAPPSPEDVAMDTLRVGIPSQRDDTGVDRWLTVELNKLRSALGNEILIPGAIKDFHNRLDAQYNHADNTAQFKQKFAERTGAVFASEYRKGQQLEPVVAHAMARQLLRMQDLETREALFAGLASTDQVVQYLSAQTLVKLQPQIAADKQLAAQALQQLRDAGTKAANGMVAWELYLAASMPGQEADAVPVILTVMNARLTNMRAGTAEVDRGEVPAIAYLDQANQAGRLDASLKTQAVQVLAPLLRIHAEHFGAQGLAEVERAASAETIAATESLLKQITKPDKSPEVAREMQSAGENAAINMQIELIQWIGGPETAGILNKAPWNVPAGAP